MYYIKLFNLNKNFLKQGVFLISLIMILWSSFIILNGVYIVIHYAITSHLTQYNDLKFVLSKIFRTHSALLMLPIWMMFFVICLKKCNLFYFSISIIFSFIIPSYYFFDNVLHPFLFNLHLYDFLLREGQTVLNPQYTKLLIYIILLIALIGMSISKKYRNIDRIFMSLITSSVLITLFLFHIALPMGIFKFSISQLENNLERESKITSLENLCRDRSCFIIDDKLNVIKQNKSNSKEIINQYSYFFYHAIDYYKDENHKILTGALGNFKGQEFDYIITIVKKEKDNYFVVMDENIGKSYSRQSEIWFSFLTTCAHFIWIYGGMLLLWQHKNRILKKRKQIMNESKETFN